MSINCGSISEKRISDVLEQEQYTNARVLWIHFIDTQPENSKEQYTLSFLSRYFKSNSNREWSENLTLIWENIQRIWPRSNDYIRIYTTAIRDLDNDTNLKEVLVNSLLQFDHSRQIARECYRMSIKGSGISQKALACMLINLNTSLKKKPADTGHDKYNAIYSSKMLSHFLQFADNFPPIGNIGFLRDAKSEIVERIEQAIVDKYTSLYLFSADIQKIDDEIGKKERELGIITDSIRSIGALSGVSLNTDDPVEIFKALSSYSKSIEKARLSLPNLISLISRKTEEISSLKRTSLLLKEEIDGSESSVKAFGYVDKPVERFLACCQDVTKDVLIQSLLLIREKRQPNPLIIESKLPDWFISEFEKWWVTKIPKSRNIHPLPPNQRNPILFLSDRMDGIQIVIPRQTITKEEGLDHADLVIYDDTKKSIYQKEIHLYDENDALLSPEVATIINSPSSVYHIKLIANNTSLSWSHMAFTEDTDYLIFDNDSHRQILSKNKPTQRCILLTDKKLRISPERIIRETGQLFGDWNGFTYFEIDPSLADSIPIDIGRVGADSKKDKYIEVQFNPQFFDEYLVIDDRRVILGSPPAVEISFDSEDTLLQTTISIHPHAPDQCSITQLKVCELINNRHLVKINIEKNGCELNLAQKELLGDEPIGSYTIRIRNSICRTDTEIKCIFLPHLSYKFSQPLYLPKESTPSQVRLNINSAHPVEFKPNTDMQVQVKENGIILKLELISKIRGQIIYWIDGKKFFSGQLALLVPHLGWHFDDEIKGTVWPMQRSFQIFSDAEFYSFGNNLAITIFLPESWNGKGILSMVPGEQKIEKDIVKGRARFSIARFYDTLNVSDVESISFDLKIIGPGIQEIYSPLFGINRWRVHPLFSPIEVINDKSGNRIIDVAWGENFKAQNRSIILWRQGKSESIATKVFEEKIPENINHIRIIKSRDILPVGIYYLQFFRKLNEWDIKPAGFTGENPNTFQITIEIKGIELLSEANACFENGKYLEGISLFKQLELKNPHLTETWKQKIMNSLVYPRNFSGEITCFEQMLATRDFFKDTDYSFIALRLVNDIDTMKHLDYTLAHKIFEIFYKILFGTPKTIICSHITGIERKICSIEGLTNEETDEIHQDIKSLKGEFENHSRIPKRDLEHSKKKRKTNIKPKNRRFKQW